MKKVWTASLLALVVGAGVLVWGAGQSWFQVERDPVTIKTKQKGPDEKVKKREIPDDYEVIGDVARPLSDVKKIVDKEVKPATNRLDPGVVPRVKKTTNLYTKSVAEAIGKPELAHRLSALISPPKFDLETYQANPEKYLTTIEPGRVNQFLPSSEEVVPIKRTSRYFSRVLQGEKVILTANAEANMPVTFYSPRLGQFQNQLSTITVAANDEGVARAEFKASSGTRGDIEIFASSPVHSGRARYLVQVQLPEQQVSSTTAADNASSN